MQRFSAVPAAALSDRDLTDSEYRTLAAIALHADKDGWCFPSQGTIAELRGMSRQTIIAHIKKLVGLGYVNVQKRTRADGGRTSNYYQVKLDYPLSNPDFTGGVKSKALQGVSNQDFTGDVKPGLDTINTPNNTPENHQDEIDPAFRSAVNAYEQGLGTIITKPVSDKIALAVKECPAGWVEDAIRVAAEHNARSWAYVNKVLQTWQTQGYQNRPYPNGQHQAEQKETTAERVERIKKMAGVE